jgi:hypothetical protein
VKKDEALLLFLLGVASASAFLTCSATRRACRFWFWTPLTATISSFFTLALGLAMSLAMGVLVAVGAVGVVGATSMVSAASSIGASGSFFHGAVKFHKEWQEGSRLGATATGQAL